MRRLSIWILILALVLLALCALWFLPRLLHHEPPPPENGLAANALSDESTATGRDGEAGPAPVAASGSAAEPNARESGEAVAGDSVAPEEAADAPAVLEGRLVDRGGRPVVGATVLAAHRADPGAPVERSARWIGYLPLDVADPARLGAAVPKRATSDGAGRFHLDGLEPGALRLAVRSPGCAPLDRNDLWLASGQALDLADLALEPPSELYGRLEDGDGRPVFGAPLVQVDEFTDAASPPLAATIGVKVDVTDARGCFRTIPVGAGGWALRALGVAGLADLTLRGDSASDGWNRRETLAEAAVLSGRVLVDTAPDDLVVRALPAESPRSPVPFVCRADARTAAVSRSGAFAFTGLDAGVVYELRAGRTSERFEDESLWSPPSFAVAPDDSARVGWSPAASVSFGLVDAHGRAVIAACETALEGALPERTGFAAPPPDQRGLFDVEGVRPLRPFAGASLHAASRGFQPIAQRIDLRPGAGTALGTLTMNPLPQISVHVRDAESGAPLAGALVTATELASGLDASDLAPLAVATDAQGDARIASYAGAGSRIEIRARGRATVRLRGPFGGGFQAPRVDVRLPRGGRVHVRVADEAGHAVPGARVEWIEGDWSPNELAAATASRIADADGRVAFGHLAPGRHAFRVQRFAPWLDTEWTLRELADGDDLEIELTSPARTSLTVRIIDAGAPLAGAPAVLLRRASVDSLFEIAAAETPLPPGVAAHLDARGAWTFWNLDPGVYVIAFGVPGQRLRGCREVAVRGGTNDFFLDLSRTAVSGTIARDANQPAAAAEILVVEPSRAYEWRNVARRHENSDANWADLLALGAEHRACAADENGAYRLLGLPLSEPFLVVARAGWDALGRSPPVEFGADPGAPVVDVAVRPAGALEVEAAPARIAFPCTLLAYPADRRSTPRIRRIFPGQSEFLGALEPGTWELELGVDGARARDRRRVEVVAGEVRTVQLSFP